MSKRSKARELAMQMLFLKDMNPDIGEKTVWRMIEERLEDEEQTRFSWFLYAGTMKHRDSIDQRISQVAKNWSLKRMAATDRNLLRLGCFEMDYHDTPKNVVIDESVELAKKFGTENSAGFVNGILDKLGGEQKREPATQDQTPSE